MTKLSRARLKISGRVQGVFYRQTTRDKGKSLGLSGWVRNMPDGTVEAEASGPQASVEEFIEWCKDGPPSASVTGVAVEWIEDVEEETPESGRFLIK